MLKEDLVGIEFTVMTPHFIFGNNGVQMAVTDGGDDGGDEPGTYLTDFMQHEDREEPSSAVTEGFCHHGNMRIFVVLNKNNIDMIRLSCNDFRQKKSLGGCVTEDGGKSCSFIELGGGN